jgi:hypothetical protein
MELFLVSAAERSCYIGPQSSKAVQGKIRPNSDDNITMSRKVSAVKPKHFAH